MLEGSGQNRQHTRKLNILVEFLEVTKHSAKEESLSKRVSSYLIASQCHNEEDANWLGQSRRAVNVLRGWFASQHGLHYAV